MRDIEFDAQVLGPVDPWFVDDVDLSIENRRVDIVVSHHEGRQWACPDCEAERVVERGHDRILLGLRLGDPNDETLEAWLAKESVRDVYLTDDLADATVLLDKAIARCQNDEVEEIRSLGDTLSRWRTEILNHHRTGASNGPTEGLNLCVKKVKRAGRGFKCFSHYRLRVLLHAGGVTWPRRPSPPRIRTRSPHSNA